MSNRDILFDINTQIEEILVFTTNSLTIQTTSLICECPFKDVLDPCKIGLILQEP